MAGFEMWPKSFVLAAPSMDSNNLMLGAILEIAVKIMGFFGVHSDDFFHFHSDFDGVGQSLDSAS